MKALHVVLVSSHIFMLFSLLALNEYMKAGVRCISNLVQSMSRFELVKNSEKFPTEIIEKHVTQSNHTRPIQPSNYYSLKITACKFPTIRCSLILTEFD